jgi:hypothetical protein
MPIANGLLGVRGRIPANVIFETTDQPFSAVLGEELVTIE